MDHEIICTNITNNTNYNIVIILPRGIITNDNTGTVCRKQYTTAQHTSSSM